ncbi:hypothetical protein ANACOL_04254 [Anaerotruncus colihominis DSM 17241]|uniref:Uncharacterized protein n=1 Tax=Anaerotruncus colihominis DSM 17241 TaxID=445972 RepID=B0PHG1_9FIRM|nr:hypothetical protein ANACOL_04254 [Anaerotruncus colihominis DSM 17241]
MVVIVRIRQGHFITKIPISAGYRSGGAPSSAFSVQDYRSNAS